MARRFTESNHSSTFIWADDALIGSATVDASIFWDKVLSSNRTDQ